MTRWIAAITFLSLAACGADGEPETPVPAPGVTLSGTVEFGVSGSF